MNPQTRITRMLIMFISAVVSFLLVTACSKSKGREIVEDWEPGYYTVALETGEPTPSYGVVQVLGSTDEGAEMKLFGNLYKQRPDTVRRKSLKYRSSSSLPGWGGVKVVMNYSIFTSMAPELVH